MPRSRAQDSGLKRSRSRSTGRAGALAGEEKSPSVEKATPRSRSRSKSRIASKTQSPNVERRRSLSSREGKSTSKGLEAPQSTWNPVDSRGVRIPSSIYFGGCSWGCGFYVGVYKAMAERWPGFQDKILITGDSAGCLFAAAIASGMPPEGMEEIYVDMATNAYNNGHHLFGPFRQMSDHTEKSIQRIIKDPLAHKNLHGRFGLGTTEFPFKHVWHWSWESIEELWDCMHGSAKMPIYCEDLRFVKGRCVIDGAYSITGEELPEQDKTLYIGIDPNAEITRPLTNHQMFFPLVGEEYKEIAQSGYDIMMQWDGTMKPKVGHRFPNYTALLILWPLRFVELIYVYITHIFFGYIFESLVLLLDALSFSKGRKTSIADAKRKY